ncbi:MAG: AAA family ATPase [Kiritimatiellae bacterium]|nr:AAA family ATPase [Kiritimatiellia bacterium]
MQALEQLMIQAGAVVEKTRPYSTRSWGEITRMLLPPPVWFLGECFGLGLGRVRLHVIFGQGGLGKSRIGFNIVRNQVLGLPFGGMPTGNKPLQHLMMGTENGLHRLQSDTRKMSAGLSEAELSRLDAHVFMATLEQPDDPYVTLQDPANVERWRMTLEERRPDVLWVDPWGDVQAGEANAETDTRWTITELLKLMAGANPNGAVVVLAHARTGARNIMEAVGYDGANFGKNSKAMYSCARCVFNLAPGSEDENPMILVACAKNNDGPRPPTFALRLDPDSMTYEVAPGFDVDAWTEELRERANGKKRKAKSHTELTEDEAIALLGDKTDTTAGIRKMLRKKEITRDDAADLVKKIVASGRWIEWRGIGKNPPTYIGTPAAIKAQRELCMQQRQGELGT